MTKNKNQVSFNRDEMLKIENHVSDRIEIIQILIKQNENIREFLIGELNFGAQFEEVENEKRIRTRNASKRSNKLGKQNK